MVLINVCGCDAIASVLAVLAVAAVATTLTGPPCSVIRLESIAWATFRCRLSQSCRIQQIASAGSKLQRKCTNLPINTSFRNKKANWRFKDTYPERRSNSSFRTAREDDSASSTYAGLILGYRSVCPYLSLPISQSRLKCLIDGQNLYGLISQPPTYGCFLFKIFEIDPCPTQIDNCFFYV